MLKNEDIICISSIDWDFIWQGHQEIMTRLARNGNRVLFIENTGVRAPRLSDAGRLKSRILNWKKGVYGIRKIEERLYVYSPLVLPFPYMKPARFINKRLMFSVLFRWLKAVGFQEPVVWTFLPTGLSLDLIEGMNPKAVIYYCIDSFQASSKDARKIRSTEKLMLGRADLVFVTSMELHDYCSRQNANVHYFPFGVNMENFIRALDLPDGVPADLKPIKRPIAGYIGGIHKWIDMELVRYAARENRDVSFVFCGPLQTDIAPVKDMPNVTFLGQKGTAELPLYVRHFDVALIPYSITDYTRNVYPTKLNEYLSVGKRVVSTDLPEVAKFNRDNGNIVSVAGSAPEFSEAIRRAISAPPDREEKMRAIDTARLNSWTNKLEKMSVLIEDVMARKSRDRENTWKSNLSKVYTATRRRLAPALAAALLCCLVIFYTPLLWVLAGPLYVKETPRKSDAIVALGAGVGESGKAGEGYQERVDTAVKLYREGMAPVIVYSSGYKYIMEEAEVMRALSVFMGVDANAILVDESPANTYEMIRDIADLAEKKDWKSVIIVSSPYHLLRLKLLSEKYLKDVNVYLVPVERASFYEKGNMVKWSQIKGIAREYAAILYYKLKGYI
ncbi:MAG: ElyC/SanA/YdcF family protein [Candidatus Omnitrophota bacterium]